MDLLKFANTFYNTSVSKFAKANPKLMAFAQETKSNVAVKRMQTALDDLTDELLASTAVTASAGSSNHVDYNLDSVTQLIWDIRKGYEAGKKNGEFDGVWGKGVEAALSGVQELSKALKFLGLINNPLSLNVGLNYKDEPEAKLGAAATTNIPLIKTLTQKIKQSKSPTRSQMESLYWSKTPGPGKPGEERYDPSMKERAYKPTGLARGLPESTRQQGSRDSGTPMDVGRPQAQKLPGKAYRPGFGKEPYNWSIDQEANTSTTFPLTEEQKAQAGKARKEELQVGSMKRKLKELIRDPASKAKVDSLSREQLEQILASDQPEGMFQAIDLAATMAKGFR